jgi:hypothetical protein
MKRTLTACMLVTLGLGATYVMAASPAVESAIKTLKAVAADPARFKTFCDMQKAAEALGEKEDAAAEAKIEALAKQLGADFEKAWSAGDDLDENSADGKEYFAAVDELDSKCPQ